MNEVVLLCLFDVIMVGVDVLVVMFVVELFEEFGKGVFDFFGGAFEVDVGELFDKLGGAISDAGDSGVGKVINTVAQGIAFDFLVDGEGAALVIVVELHLGSVETGLAFDEVADGGVFYDHA